MVAGDGAVQGEGSSPSVHRYRLGCQPWPGELHWLLQESKWVARRGRLLSSHVPSPIVGHCLPRELQHGGFRRVREGHLDGAGLDGKHWASQSLLIMPGCALVIKTSESHSDLQS